jgi:L-rhamnose mutarotase
MCTKWAEGLSGAASWSREGRQVIRHGFHVRLHPGALDEYVRLHDPVPPAVMEQLRSAGIRNYSIYAQGQDLFGSLAFTDRDQLKRALSYDAAPEWTKAVSELMIGRTVDPSTGLLAGLPEVFAMGWDS